MPKSNLHVRMFNGNHSNPHLVILQVNVISLDCMVPDVGLPFFKYPGNSNPSHGHGFTNFWFQKLWPNYLESWREQISAQGFWFRVSYIRHVVSRRIAVCYLLLFAVELVERKP